MSTQARANEQAAYTGLVEYIKDHFEPDNLWTLRELAEWAKCNQCFGFGWTDVELTNAIIDLYGPEDIYNEDALREALARLT